MKVWMVHCSPSLVCPGSSICDFLEALCAFLCFYVVLLFPYFLVEFPYVTLLFLYCCIFVKMCVHPSSYFFSERTQGLQIWDSGAVYAFACLSVSFSSVLSCPVPGPSVCPSACLFAWDLHFLARTTASMSREFNHDWLCQPHKWLRQSLFPRPRSLGACFLPWTDYHLRAQNVLNTYISRRKTVAQENARRSLECI